MDRLRTSVPALPISFNNYVLSVYDLEPLGYDIRCHASSAGIACAIVQKQYEYHHDDVHCRVEPNDVVFDAGACWGETTLLFAHQAGPLGWVVSFEFTPNNIAVFKRNAILNPHLTSRIHLVEAPIWRASGQRLHFVDWGPGSRITEDTQKYSSYEGLVETTTIDDTAHRFDMTRVNFIKMDIEGAELEALKGSERTLRKHRPKLAISLYHNPEDIETIPRYLAGLDLGYRFFLEHHTIYNNETVLFAVP